MRWTIWVGIAALGVMACDDPKRRSLVRPMFCNGQLCGYEVSGIANKIPGWHPDDPAVALVSQGASLSTTTKDIWEPFGRCMSVVVLADVPEGVELWLTAEIEGATESVLIPPGRWQPHQHDFHLDRTDDGGRFLPGRFTLSKFGEGVVKIARFFPTRCGDFERSFEPADSFPF
jgi:hypothetical protein